MRASQVLDVNSCYAYLLLCRDFASTCVLAEEQGRPAGFVSAYGPPGRPDVIFVWQIAVRKDLQGCGLAKALIFELLKRDACSGVSYLETTISPSNTGSRALFHSVAKRLGTRCEEKEGFPSSLFGDARHEKEALYRIGPFPRQH